MGLNRRKKSGRTIGGSRLIVDGQPIFTVIKYTPDLRKQSKTDFFVEGNEFVTTTTTTISPTTTTTTTISCNLVTQQYENLITQNGDNLVFCD
jgi:hypothetical protein